MTPIPHMKRNDLARHCIHGDPDPLLVGLFLHKAPHLIGFRFQTGQEHYGWLGRTLRMQVIGARRKAFHHKVQEPRETDTHGPADPPEGETLPQQLGDPLALRLGNSPVHGVRHKLATARFALMILLPMAGMAIFLVSGRSTRGAGVSDDHGCW